SAIGQRDVRMTPLQAANMVVSLLNGGRLTAPRVVSEVRFRDGGIKRSYDVRRHGSRISQTTASQLLAMMRETVRSGTASSLQDHPWKLAGKTGTAELGQTGHRVNQWFVGYGPTDRPQFAAAIVVYDVENHGKHMAQQLFAELADIVR